MRQEPISWAELRYGNDWQRGYHDGRENAYKFMRAAINVKDEEFPDPPESDSDYHKGWRAGERVVLGLVCEANKRRLCKLPERERVKRK